ncbi:MAG: hypothetical protein U0Q15_04755 [Kineosporiaceae bacterium]
MRRRRRPGRTAAWSFALAAVLVLVAPAGLAMAVFGHTTPATASASWSTATLAAPTGFAASRPCPSAGPALKGSTTATSSGTSVVVTTPSAASGDVLLAFVTASASATITISPSSWQGMGSQTVASSYTANGFFLPLSAAPAASYTFSWSSGKGSVVLMSYTRVDPYTPVANQQSTMNSTGSTSATSPTTTPSRVPGTVVLGVAVAGAPTVSDPTGMTQRGAPTAPDTVVGLTVWDDDITASGATSAYTTSWTGTRTSAVLFAYLQGTSTPTKDPTVTLTWTASASPAAGYTITRSDAQVFTVSGQASATYTDSTTTASTAYSYTIRSTVGSWTSSGSASANAAACP